MQKFCVKVPASSANLGPGFDVLGMALDIFNEFHVTCGAENAPGIRVEGAWSPEVSCGEDNLFSRALHAGLDSAGVECPPVSTTFISRIPLARGLGSSATGILGGLLAARTITGGKLPEGELLRLAVEMEGHADNIMAAYMGGIVINYERAGVPRGMRIVPQGRLEAALAIPDLKTSTKQARAILPDSYPRGDVVTTIRNVSLLVMALATGQWEVLASAMEDRIHEPYRMPLIPGFQQVKEAALSSGAHGVAISGSGPTVIALCSDNAVHVAGQMAAVFERNGIACGSMAAAVSDRGAFIEWGGQ